MMFVHLSDTLKLKAWTIELLTDSRSITFRTFVSPRHQLETFVLQNLLLHRRLPVFRMEVTDRLVLKNFHSHYSMQEISQNHL